MKTFLQITNGLVEATLETSTDAAPDKKTWPAGRIFVEVPEEHRSNPNALLRGAYDTETGAITPFVAPNPTKLSHADVLALLTPDEWSEMNKFHPNANGQSVSGTPYNDAQVFWAVSVFNKAEYIDVADPRLGQILGMLAAKRILTPQRSAQLQQQMVDVATSKAAARA